MMEKDHNVLNGMVYSQMNTGVSDQFEAVGVDVYSQGSLAIADLTHVNSQSLISVYDNKGVIIKAVKSNGMEVVRIRVHSKGVNQVQIQNGSNLFTQEVMFH